MAKDLIKQLTNGKLVTNADGYVKAIKQLKTTDGQSLEIQVEPTSEIFMNLSKDILVSELNLHDLKLFLINWFPLINVLHGAKKYDYDYAIPAATFKDPTADMTEEDLKKGAEIFVQEVFTVLNEDTLFYDAHIFDEEISDVGMTPAQSMTILRRLVNVGNKAIDKALQSRTAQKIVDNITETVNIDGLDIVAIQKVLDETLTKYGSATDQLMSAIINGTQYIFDTQFDSNEFYLLANKKYSSNFKVDYKRNSFQLKNTDNEFDFAGVKVVDFDYEIGFKDIPAYSTIQFMLIHKNAIENVTHFRKSKNIDTTSMYAKFRQYVKAAPYYRKDKPIIAFSGTIAETTTTKSK